MPTYPAEAPAAPPAQVPTSFSDAAGATYHLRLTLGLIDEVRREHGVRLGDLVRDTDQLSDFLFDSPEKFGAVVWLLCRHQAEGAGVTPEAFYAEFDGATYGRAIEALLGAIADFFPRSAVAAQIKESTAALLEDMDRRMVARIKAGELAALARPNSSGTAGASAGSRVSTPAHSPSANSRPSPAGANSPSGPARSG